MDIKDLQYLMTEAQKLFESTETDEFTDSQLNDVIIKYNELITMYNKQYINDKDHDLLELASIVHDDHDHMGFK